MRRGLFARRSTWTGLTPAEKSIRMARTLGVRHPGWVFSHATAAAVHGLPVSYSELTCIHVTTPPAIQELGSNGVVRHVSRELEATVVGGVRVTPLARSVVDCLRTQGFRDGLIVADASLRMGLAPEDLAAELARQSGNRGIRQAVETARYADPRAESGGESVARAVMIEQGFAVPSLQVSLPDPVSPRHSFRPDYLWTLPSGKQVAGELDGSQKYTDPAMTHGHDVTDVLLRERRRESRINALGIPVVRFTFAEVLDVPYFVRLLETFGIPRRSRM